MPAAAKHRPRRCTPYIAGDSSRSGTQSPLATTGSSRISVNVSARALRSGSAPVPCRLQAEQAAIPAQPWAVQRPTRAATRDVRMRDGKKITQASFTEKAWQAIVAAPEVRAFQPVLGNVGTVHNVPPEVPTPWAPTGPSLLGNDMNCSAHSYRALQAH